MLNRKDEEQSTEVLLLCAPGFVLEKMCAARALTLVNGWETVRFELLNTRICDLGLQIEGSPLSLYLQASAGN